MTDEEAIKEILIQQHKAGIDKFFEEIIEKLKPVKNNKKECQEMTDNEIIKALECCYQTLCCEECPYSSKNNTYIRLKYVLCNDVLMNDVIGLINRQQAEIERLNKEVDHLSQCVLYHEGQIVDAIKDFAERLKATYPPREDKRCTLDDCYTLDVIDNLVKEMTEN